LSKSPAVTISAIRVARAERAASLPSPPTSVRQPRAGGPRAVRDRGRRRTGWGCLEPLSSLSSRRASEILVSGQDSTASSPSDTATSNRAIPDEQFVDFVDAFGPAGVRSICFALADVKRFVNAATLPADAPFGRER